MKKREEKFKIRKSSIDGLGAFAVRPIKKGELICLMKGEIISVAELKKRYDAGLERRSDPLQIGEAEYLDLDEPYVLINHSCEPNSFIKNKNELVAIKDIKLNEEITYDYSATEWSDDASWERYDEYEWTIECHCPSPLCRKIIREFRFLPEDVHRRYIKNGSVSKFIAEKYKRCHGK